MIAKIKLDKKIIIKEVTRFGDPVWWPLALNRSEPFCPKCCLTVSIYGFSSEPFWTVLNRSEKDLRAEPFRTVLHSSINLLSPLGQNRSEPFCAEGHQPKLHV